MSRHRAPRPSRRRGLLTVAVAALAVLGLALPASAFFSVGSTAATGASRAGTLGTPGATTSAVTATNVTFTVTAPPTGPTPTAYRVARTAPTAAASVCTVAGSTGTCSDTAPVDGQTNTYAVYARLSGTTWESLSPRTLTVVVPSKDTTAPVTTASQSPVANAAGWTTTGVTVTLSATDASGVAATYYTTNGSTPTTASTAYTAPFTVASTSTVRFFSVDTVGNAETPKTYDVRVDGTAPAGSVTSPTAGTLVGGTVTVTGTSTDAGSGVASVQPQVQQGSGAFAALGTAITTGASTWSTSWATGGLADGAYALRAVVTDVAGNTFTTSAVSVTVQNTTLTVTSSTGTPTAGTPFDLTIRTGSNITGSQAISVTGPQNSPNGTAPTVPTTATFTNGVATISVTATKSGSQTIVVKLTSDNRQGSTTVVVRPKDQGQLFFTTCAGTGITNVSCPTNSATASLTAPRGNNVTFMVSRRATDDLGNSLTDASVTVTLVPSAGSVNGSPITLGAGVTSSGTITYNPPGNSGGTRTVDATGTTTGVATASARLTLTFQ